MNPGQRPVLLPGARTARYGASFTIKASPSDTVRGPSFRPRSKSPEHFPDTAAFPSESLATADSLLGNIFHGELSVAQLFHMRPAPGYTDFRTPIRGLFQASSATHGGGGVTGIPALQVVKQIAKAP